MKNKITISDIDGNEWVYSKTVEDHFFRPRGLMTDKLNKQKYNAVGVVGSPACGDQMKVWLKIKDEKIVDFRWKTFGCASAIASTSILTEMVNGKSLEEAEKITAYDIVKKLGGLPKRKIHCSVLGDQALREAIKRYRQIKKQGIK